ncbi:amidase [Paraliobacillus quinghaiensis]|uniref:Amidase n=1 Tax=Paraliobacillus quinghaiensis TaxID=470815 RepID=A0A917TVG4_9BACI|nr:amidase family protein [Paraliobacillus quinghaiensis]GGM39933.1 amidase [Paraliobacillus quinghaiensis]
MTFQIEEATIRDIQEALQAGIVTSKQLVQQYIDRIEALDQNGPKINAIRQINPDALFLAEVCDKERGKEKQGPLYGVPIILKDNIDTADKMATTAGSVALKDNYAKRDAFIVSKLREAGAIILGTANLTEFANFMAYEMPNGYSSLGGQVLNPYKPGVFDVGGSSAGTGAAVAANLVTAGIGTETSGSILSPASSNSLVGLKPTVGLVSRSGIIPISHSQDTAGPLTKTVEDAAIMLNAIAGYDEADIVTKNCVDNVPSDYTAFLLENGLNESRIGIDRSTFNELSANEKAVMEESISTIEKLGATIIDPIEVSAPELDMVVMKHEFKHDLNAYLENVSDAVPVHNLEEIIAYNKNHAEVALRYNQELLEDSQAMSDDPNDSTYLESRASDVKYAGELGIDTTMKQHNLDAILSVNNWGAALPAKAGYPSITVPAGYTDEGKPVGVTFSAKAFSEPTLLKFGYAYEQATKHRKQPMVNN